MDGWSDVQAVGVERFGDRLVRLESCISHELIEQVVRESGRVSGRKCRLNSPSTVWLVLAMGLLTAVPIRGVYRRSRCFREGEKIPTRAALCKARQRLGIKPLLWLFREVVTLLCCPVVAGGFDAGWRLMGIDGVSFTAPVTPGNIRACGLLKGGDTAQSTGGFPLVCKVSLVELGSHVEYAFAWRSQAQGNRLSPGV